MKNSRLIKIAGVTTENVERRKLLALVGITTIIAGAPSKWTKPLINSVVLPAHAQTSDCITDAQAGGPLIGHASSASSCQAACEFEASSQNAQLCAVEETLDASNATQCSCDLDLP